MPSSPEKVRTAAQELLQSPIAPDAAPAELALRSALMVAAPQLLSMVPQDPDELDAMIEWAANRLLELRSDWLLADTDASAEDIADAELVAGDRPQVYDHLADEDYVEPAAPDHGEP